MLAQRSTQSSASPQEDFDEPVKPVAVAEVAEVAVKVVEQIDAPAPMP